jgi:hypothetical protein
MGPNLNVVCIYATDSGATRASPSIHVVNGSGELDLLHAHFYVPVTLRGKHCEKSIEAMLNSGAQGCFMHPQFVKEHGVVTHALKRPIGLGNIDGLPNCSGSITHYAVLGVIIDGHLTKAFFHIANIGREDAILGIDWLRCYNPQVNWKLDSISFLRCGACREQATALPEVESNLVEPGPMPVTPGDTTEAPFY